jgi:hypothetical protein
VIVKLVAAVVSGTTPVTVTVPSPISLKGTLAVVDVCTVTEDGSGVPLGTLVGVLVGACVGAG